MSTIVKYSTGSTYTLVPNKVDIEKVQELGGQYHIPYSSIVGMLRLGLGVQRITVSGDILDMSACLWHDVVAISFDSGTSYQTVYFAGVPHTSDCWSGIYPYALSLLASPLKEQTAVRYPTTGYKWGNQSIPGISQAGNVNAYPIIHYLAPLFYAPLSNTLIDFAGQGLGFIRATAKVHGGVSYPINTPIFDSGLYLASDISPDVATWTPPASTVRTIAMQIKQTRYSWSIGGGGVNLLTANQSNAETDTTGMEIVSSGTLTRNTVTPIAGVGDFKVVATNAATNVNLRQTSRTAVTAGAVYCAQVTFKTSGCAGGRTFRTALEWYNAGGASIGLDYGDTVNVFTTNYYYAQTAIAPVGAVTVNFYCILMTAEIGEILYADNLMIQAIPNVLTIWTAFHNLLAINTATHVLSWMDGTDTVSAAFPIAAYIVGAVVDIVVIDDTAHAVTVAVYPASGAWTIATGTLAALAYGSMDLGGLEGSIANLTEFDYVLTSAEYQALAYSSLSLLYNEWSDVTLGLLGQRYIGNRYAGEIVKGSDKRLLNANGSDISALLGGTDIAIGSSAVTITQSQGLAARWYVEVKRTDV